MCGYHPDNFLYCLTEAEEPAPAKPRGFVCKICGFVYESDTLPEDFTCPICRRPASDFEPLT